MSHKSSRTMKESWENAREVKELQKAALDKAFPPSPFGKNLRKIREQLGLSQSELANRAGITPAALSMIESGSREPGLYTILRILEVIPVKFEKLMES